MSPRRYKTPLSGTSLLLVLLALGAIYIFQPGLLPQPIAQFGDQIAKQLEPLTKQLEPLAKQLEPLTKQVPGLPQLPGAPPPAAQQPSDGSVASGTPGSLPDMPQKPQPQEITFKGCPPEGDGGDPALNRLKNRVDEGKHVPVQFDAVLNLPWPKSIERRDRDRWSASDTAAIAKYEGIPIAVEGYLFDAKQEGPESTNCHGADEDMRDHHIWLIKSPGDDRTRSIVVETTPRVRANRPTWTTSALDNIAKNKQRVRINGWLFMDPEHPDQVGQTRGTLWEIHPIMKIEVQQQGNWVPF